MTDPLTEIPNVGPAVARMLRRLGVESLDDLRGRDGGELYDRLCELDGYQADPCVLDTFRAVVAYAAGGPPVPWWEYSRARNAAAAG